MARMVMFGGGAEGLCFIVRPLCKRSAKVKDDKQCKMLSVKEPPHFETVYSPTSSQSVT